MYCFWSKESKTDIKDGCVSPPPPRPLEQSVHRWGLKARIIKLCKTDRWLNLRREWWFTAVMIIVIANYWTLHVVCLIFFEGLNFMRFFIAENLNKYKSLQKQIQIKIVTVLVILLSQVLYFVAELPVLNRFSLQCVPLAVLAAVLHLSIFFT